MHRAKIVVMRGTCTRAAIVAFVASTSLQVATQEAIPGDLLIKLERTACFGRCPVYSVTIDAKGGVVFEGARFVQADGRHTASVPTTSVAALLATAQRIGFFDLQESYRAPITDLPTTFVTITANGRTKRVEDYFGAPQGLKDLERQIDEAAGTERWIRTVQRGALSFYLTKPFCRRNDTSCTGHS